MTFRQLEYVIEVAERGSISVAARNLMISQPSLSQSIRGVEKELNITLFDRGAVPLVPTPAGAVFLKKARSILSTLEDMKQELSQTGAAPRELTIGISDAGILINKRIFSQFRQQYPDIKLLLVERDQHQLERMLEAGKLDMIFTMVPNENPNLTVVPLVEDALVLALPKSHPVSRECEERYPDMLDSRGQQMYFPEVDLARCAQVRYVLSGRDRLKLAQLSALRTAFEPEIAFETDSLPSAVGLAAWDPHGTVVPRLYSTLYDGAERPYFFQCRQKLPTWSFALSLQKGVRLSGPALAYIRLFIRCIDSLGLLTGHRSAEELVKRLERDAARRR